MEKERGILSNNIGIFRMAKESRFLPNVLLALFLFIVIMFISEFAAIPIERALFNIIPASRGNLNIEALRFAINHLAIPFGASILAFFAWVRFIERRKISTMGFTRENVIKKYLTGFIVGILMMTASVIIFAVLGMVEFEMGDPSRQGISALGGIFIVLTGWIIQGASEEIMVRGWLLPIVGARHNAALGIFVSSTIFGALHLLNPNVTALSFINLVLFGVFAAVYVMWEGSLWGICGLHSAWNWAQGNLFGFEVSGTIPAGGILFNLKTKGPDIITGGFFGPEGGLVETVLLSVGIIILIILIKKRGQKL